MELNERLMYNSIEIRVIPLATKEGTKNKFKTECALEK